MEISLYNIKNHADKIIKNENTTEELWLFKKEKFFKIKALLATSMPAPVKPAPPRYEVSFSFFSGTSYQYDFSDPLYLKQLQKYEQQMADFLKINNSIAEPSEVLYMSPSGLVKIRSL